MALLPDFASLDYEQRQRLLRKYARAHTECVQLWEAARLIRDTGAFTKDFHPTQDLGHKRWLDETVIELYILGGAAQGGGGTDGER